MNSLFPDFEDVTLDAYQPQDPSQEQALHAVKEYAELMVKAHLVTGLTFIGEPGVGKTHLAQAVLRHAQQHGYKIETMTASGYLELHHALIRRVEDNDDLASISRQIRRISYKTDFVLFDDLGREYDPGSGFATSVLFNVLRDRSNRRLPTLITTNLSIEKLHDRYTGGFVSMLYGKTKIINIGGEDYRLASGANRN
jgi:DNA replication protein DnaC